MRRLLAVMLMGLLLTVPGMAWTPGTEAISAGMAIAEARMAQEALSAVGQYTELTETVRAVMVSNLEPAQKERVVQALVDLAKYKVDQEAKAEVLKAQTKESIAGKIFDLSVKLISLGAAIFAAVKVTT